MSVIDVANGDLEIEVPLSKSERAYAWLHQRISWGDFAAGYRLVLAPIAEELDMSVVPVREAIRRLEAEGLVTFERNVGARVAVIDEQEYVYAMQTLGLVEGSATALAAPLLSSDDLERAEAVNEQMTRLLDDFDPHEFTRLNQRFHAVLYERCPNPHIRELVHRGWGRLANLRDSTFAFVPDRSQHSVAEHVQLIELIRQGADPLTIELAARDHRWRTMNAFIAARGQLTPPPHPTTADHQPIRREP
jgi:DNA-binding GntR family transcriptional regulator